MAAGGPGTAAARCPTKPGGPHLDPHGFRELRFLHVDQGTRQVGSQPRIVALPHQVFVRTHASAPVGVLSRVQFVPLRFFSLASLRLLAVARGGDRISVVPRGTIARMATPDRMRGRMSGLHIMLVTDGARSGDLKAGVVASATTLEFSTVSGGVAAAVAPALPLTAFGRYDAAPDASAA